MATTTRTAAPLDPDRTDAKVAEAAVPAPAPRGSADMIPATEIRCTTSPDRFAPAWGDNAVRAFEMLGQVALQIRFAGEPEGPVGLDDTAGILPHQYTLLTADLNPATARRVAAELVAEADRADAKSWYR